MIKNFTCKETEIIWNGKYSRKLPNNIQNVARRKLRMLNNAHVLNDLLVPPGNQLEKLTGNRKAQYSIRINKQWRICFKWKDSHIYDVEIIDYH